MSIFIVGPSKNYIMSILFQRNVTIYIDSEWTKIFSILTQYRT
jgi:hypothetical protein